MQVYFLLAELQRHPGRARPLELFHLHAQHVAVEVQARLQVPRGEHHMIDVVDHGLRLSIRSGLYSSTVSPRWLMTLLAKRTRPRSPFEVRRASTTSASTWMVSPITVGPFTSSVAFRNARPVSCIVGRSRPSEHE